MNYIYNDDTLFHSVGFNIAKMESIMKNGILSFNKAKEMGINYARNYDGYNLNNGISLTRYLYINPYIDDSSYNKYITRGISFIVEDVDFISDKDIEKRIHNSDEVTVNNYIPKSNIKGLIIPSEYRELTLDQVNYLRLNSNNIFNIRDNCNNIFEVLKEYNYNVDYNDFAEYMLELNQLGICAKKYRDNNNTDNIDYKETLDNYYDLLRELDEFIGINVYNCFCSYFKKEVTLYEVVEYLNSKYLNLNIYDLPFNKEKRVRL